MSGNVHIPPLTILWEENLIRRKNPPVGLRNLGNTCYLNSVLQCLTYTAPLANFCLQGQHSKICSSYNGRSSANCPFCFLERQIARSLTLDAPTDAPNKIHNRLQQFAKHFQNGRQEDAHELLRYAVEACNNVCVQLQKQIQHNSRQAKQADFKVKGEPDTVVKRIFGGVLQSQVKCQACDGESNKLDDIMDLSLDIVRIHSLKDALCRFFQPEVLDGDNKYRCSKCKKLSAARKQMSVSQAPIVLVIQFKRFENVYGGKIDRHITFEERLCLAGYMCEASKDLKPEYSLYGVVVHAGSTQDGGHYYAYVKDSRGRWFCCDDSNVYAVNTQAVLGEKSYMLFYVRKNTGPRDNLAPCNVSTPSPPTTPDTDLSEPPKYNPNTGVRPKAANFYNMVTNEPKVEPQVKYGSLEFSREQYDKPTKLDQQPPDESLVKGTLNQLPQINGVSENYLPKSSHPKCDEKAMISVSDCCQHSSYPNLTAFCSEVSESCPSPNTGVENRSLKLEETTVSSSGFEVRLQSDTSKGFEANVTNDQGGAITAVSAIENVRQISDVVDSKFEDVSEDATGEAMQIGRKRLIGSFARASLGKEEEVSECQGTVPLIDTCGGYTNKSSRTWFSSGIEEFKLQLINEARNQLQFSGWCDSVKESMQAAKKQRISDQLWSFESNQRRQLVSDVHHKLEQVPKVVKQHLVELLLSHFLTKKIC